MVSKTFTQKIATCSINLSIFSSLLFFSNNMQAQCMIDFVATPIQSVCINNGTLSDPSDDYFTITLTAAATFGGTLYEAVVGANPDGTGGTVLENALYGTPVILGDGADAGTFVADGSTTYTITVRAVSEPTCHVDYTSTTVASCSNVCVLSLSSPPVQSLCDDNGTLSDPSDDYFTIDFLATGLNVGTHYQVVLDANDNGTGGTVLATAPYNSLVTVGDGNNGAIGIFAADGATQYAITVRDATNNLCHLDYTTIPIGSCSALCFLTISSPPVQSLCDDNGTPSDDSDDFYTITFAATAINGGGTYEAVLNANPDGTGGTVLGTATYNSTLTVGNGVNGATGTFSADGSTQYVVTIRDTNEPTCHEDYTTTAIPSCSNACLLTVVPPIQSPCINNTTLSDPSDDYFTVTVDATALNGGTQYEVVLNANPDGTGGTVLETSLYGVPVILGDGADAGLFAADGSTTYNLTVRAASEPTCHEDFTTTIVASCSNLCSLTFVSVPVQSLCNDNGTDTDPSDDYYTIDFIATSLNGGANYEVVLNANPDGTGGTVLGTAPYNSIITVGDGTNGAIGTFAADGSTQYVVTVRDADDNLCHSDYTTLPVLSCSLGCLLTISSPPVQSLCNDNGTDTDPSDDYYTIDFIATSLNGGANYEVVLNANPDGTGGTVLGTAPYNSIITVGDGNNGATGTFVADGSTQYVVTVRDVDDNLCHSDYTTLPVLSCSLGCLLTISSPPVQSLCNDNGTDTDPSDDYYTIDFIATSLNGGTNYEVVLNANPDGTGGTVLGTAPYNSIITVGDGNNGATGTFAADGSTQYVVTVRDADDNLCHSDYTTLPVLSCSLGCLLTISSPPVQSLCNENGTDTDPSDDYYTIDFIATSLNGGANYEVVLNANADGTGGTVLGTAPYNSIITVGDGNNGATGTFAADGSTQYVVTVRDADDNLCHSDYTTLPVLSCSLGCLLTISSPPVQSLCNDSGTDTDPSDDYYTIDFIATSLNGGANYEVVLNANPDGTGGTVLGTAPYNSIITVGDGNNGATGTFAADGSTQYVVTVRDADDNLCHSDYTTLPVLSCSLGCLLTISSPPVQSLCNDNGTDTDPSDDYYTIDFIATSLNGGANYEVVLNANPDGTGGTVLGTAPYNSIITVGDGNNGATGTFVADGSTQYVVTVRDVDDNLCHSDYTTLPVLSCSLGCLLTISSPPVQSLCNDNGTDTDPSDDYYTIDFIATSLNGGANYEVVLNANPDGTGGTVLGTAPYNSIITVGDGNNGATGTFVADGSTQYVVTVRDVDDNLCHSDYTTLPVLSCSLGCLLTISSPPVQSLCNDNGTDTDPSDDYYTIDFIATSLNGGANYEVVLNANPDGTGGTVLGTAPYNTIITVGDGNNGATGTFAADGSTQYVVTVRDADDNLCHSDYTTLPVLSCSLGCLLTISSPPVQSLCNDNGTDTDPSDDYYTIDFIATSLNGGTNYEVVLNANPDGTGGTVLGTAPYNTIITVGDGNNGATGTFAADGSTQYVVTVRDADDNLCHSDYTTLPVLSCSLGCLLTISSPPVQSLCNDNGTDTDPSDDYYTIDFIATSLNGGTNYEVVLNANPDGTGGTVLGTAPYNSIITVGDGNNGATGTFAADGSTQYVVTVRDADDNLCHSDYTTLPVLSCSTGCLLTVVPPIQSICLNNGTLSDPADDYFTVTVDAVAVNGGTQYEVVLDANADGTGGTILATSFYGVPVILGAGADAGLFIADGTTTYNLTIRAVSDPTCHEDFTTTPVESCSNLCSLTFIAVPVQSLCNDNGTPANAADDYFTIDFLATALNAGNNYEVVLNANPDGTGGTVLGTAPYNSLITVGDGTNGAIGTFAADGSTTYIVTLRDADDNLCHTDYTTLPVLSCSNNCLLTVVPPIQSPCLNNLTLSDPSDDYFTVTVDAIALNGGTQYEVVLNANSDGTGGTVLETSIYGVPVILGDGADQGLFVADGSTTYNLTVRTVNEPTCHEDFITTPVESCSNTCLLTVVPPIQSPCLNNLTLSDPSDDYFTVTVDAIALNGGTQYEVVLNANPDGTGGTVLETSIYGVPVILGDGADQGLFVADGSTTYNLTVRAVSEPTCHESFTTTAVASCSNTCLLTVVPPIQSPCLNNLTLSDPSDDYFTVTVDAIALNGGTQYEVVLNANPDGTGGTVLETSIYGVPVILGDGADQGLFVADGSTTYNLTVRAVSEPTCHEDFTTTPVASCSNTCLLTVVPPIQSPCLNNLTLSDPSDDYFTVTVDAIALNGGTQYEVVLNANPDGTGGTVIETSIYGVPVILGDGADQGLFVADGSTTYNLTVRAVSEPTCHEDFTTTPVASCSDECLLTLVVPIQSPCINNGTLSDPSDDYFTVTVDAIALNGGTQYEVVLDANPDGTGGTVLETSIYGVPVILGDGADAGLFVADGSTTYNLTVRAVSSTMCHQDFTTTPVGACSNECLLTTTPPIQSLCNDNGTISNIADDYFTITFDAVAVNGGLQYQVVLDANVDGTGGTVLGTAQYGFPITVGDGTNGATGTFAADGNSTYNLTVRDVTNNTCHVDYTSSPVENCSFGPGNCTELYISEYLQGTGSNNCLEIYNPTNNVVDLSALNYQVRFYFDGSAIPSTPISLSGTIAPGAVFVLCDDNASTELLAIANQTSAVNFFDGNDVVEVIKIGVPVDIIGQIGVNPGTSGWTGTCGSTQNNVLRRFASVLRGDINGLNAFDPCEEFDAFSADDFTGIGGHLSDCIPCVIQINGTVVTGETCEGDEDGSLIVNATTNNGLLEYSIDGTNFQTTNTFTELAAGNYTITARVVGISTCTDVINTTIDAGSNVVIDDIIITPESCPNSINGAIEITASCVNCTGNLAYSINGTDFQLSNTFNNLPAGTYNITVRDNIKTSCFATDVTEIVLTENPAIDLISSTDPTACGGDDGVIIINLNEGTAGETYTINYNDGNSQTTTAILGIDNNLEIAGLTAGTYSDFEITTPNGCMATSSTTVVISDPAFMISSINGINSTTCINPNGIIIISINGGITGDSYTINYQRNGNAQTATAILTTNGTLEIMGLNAGTFSNFTVTSSEGCTAQNSTTVTLENPSFSVSTITSTNPTNCVNPNGTILITLNNGTPGDTYTIEYDDNGNGQNTTAILSTDNTLEINGLNAGTYNNFFIIAPNGCSTNSSVAITLDAVSFSIIDVNSSNPTDCANPNGSITFTLDGGMAGDNYTINYTQNGGTQTTIATLTATNTLEITGLNAGVYNDFEVVAQNGCTAENSSSITLSNPAFSITEISGSNPTNCTNPDGSITIILDDGTVGNTYTIDFEANGNTQSATAVLTTDNSLEITDLNEGFYSNFIVTGPDGCTAGNSTTITLTNPSFSIQNVMGTDPTDCANPNGTITIFIENGTPNDTYSIDYQQNENPASVSGVLSATNTLEISNLGEGIYSDFQVTASNGCFAQNEPIITLINPSFSIEDITGTSPISCSNPDGTITILLDSGNTGNTYVIDFQKNGIGQSATGVLSNGNTLAIDGLDGGFYDNFVVTAPNGCTASSQISITFTNPEPIVSVITGSNPSVCGGENGALSLTLNNGTIGDTYMVNYDDDGNSQTATTTLSSNNTLDISGLDAGIYDNFTVTASNGCSQNSSTSVTITDPALVIDNISSNNPTSCGGMEGSISITINGLENTTYSIDYQADEINQSATAVLDSEGNLIITGLSAGNYTNFQISSNNGCTANSSNEIILSNPLLSISEITGTNPSVCLAADGSIELILNGAVGGNYEVTYDFDGTTMTQTVVLNNNALVISNLTAGTYNNFIVTEQNTTCTATSQMDEILTVPCNTDYEFVKTNTPNGEVAQGDQILYTLALTNNGSGPGSNIVISDAAPSNTTYVMGSAMISAGTGTIDTENPLMATFPTIGMGETVEIQFAVTVNADAANGTTIDNIANFTEDGGGSNPSNQVTNTVVAGIVLADKTATFDDANGDGFLNPTEQVNYTITVMNNGNSAANNVSLTDAIPTGTSYVTNSLIASQGSIDDSGNPLLANIGTILPNETATISFSVVVESPFTNMPSQISNQAIISADGQMDSPTDDPNNPTNDPMIPGDAGDPTVLEVVPSAEAFVTAPCGCLNNQSAAGNDGQFSEQITVNGPAGANWVVVSSNGLFQANSPLPPAAPTPFPADFALTETSPGTYVLNGIHVDEIGYNVTLSDGNQTLIFPTTGVNTCHYPNLNLSGIVNGQVFCVGQDGLVTVTATADGNPAGTITNFEIIGETAFEVVDNQMTFDPINLEQGFYSIVFEFDAGEATQNDPTDPGCQAEKVVNFMVGLANVIECQPTLITSTSLGDCTANPALQAPNILVENSPVINISSTPAGPFELGNTVVTWTVTGEDGCSETCEQLVQVKDTQPPAINCGDPVTVATGDDNCEFDSEDLVIDFAEDNCSEVTLTNDAPATMPPGSYMIEFTATDEEGNASTCILTVEVIDDTPPTLLSCPENIELLATTETGGPATWELPTGTDNCGGIVTATSTFTPGDFFEIGNTEVTYEVTDESGNVVECSFVITMLPTAGETRIIAGNIRTEAMEGTEFALVDLDGDNNVMLTNSTDVEGRFAFDVPVGGNYSLTPGKSINPMNGVTTYDLYLINKHLLAEKEINSPYQLIASDADKSGVIDSTDMRTLQDLILWNTTDFNNNDSWRFVDATYEFGDTLQQQENFPEFIDIETLLMPVTDADFVALKVGDINGDALANSESIGPNENDWEVLELTTVNLNMKADKTYEVPIYAESSFNHVGFQFTLDFEQGLLELVDITPGLAQPENMGLNLVDAGIITTSWWNHTAVALTEKEPLFTLNFKAKTDLALADAFKLNSSFTPAQAYRDSTEFERVELNYTPDPDFEFQLFQNYPNPFKDKTTIGFILPEDARGTFTIGDMSGRVIWKFTGDFKRGYNELEVLEEYLGTNTVYFYQLETEEDFGAKQLILIGFGN